MLSGLLRCCLIKLHHVKEKKIMIPMYSEAVPAGNGGGTLEKQNLKLFPPHMHPR
jgi:hypothetical protein